MNVFEMRDRLVHDFDAITEAVRAWPCRTLLDSPPADPSCRYDESSCTGWAVALTREGVVDVRC